MEVVLRAGVVYAVLLLLFRITGKRALSQITTFDFILLLIISEATQQALIGEDFSLITMAVVVTTLIGIDMLLDRLGMWIPPLGKAIDGVPLVLVEEGQPIEERLRRSRISIEDIMESARSSQGLERLEQIKYVVLERNGALSVIPRREAGGA